jgi:dTMP kinase
MAKLIVIEGLDGVGTTTQTKLLRDYLLEQGYSVVKSAEPTSTILGQEIRRLLKDTAEKDHDLLVCLALSFAADRRL